MLSTWLSRYMIREPLNATHECPADASEFLRKHPWPGRSISDTFDDSTHRQGDILKRFLDALNILCGKTGDLESLDDDPTSNDDRMLFDVTEAGSERPFYWSPALQQNFREELEK
jgi:phosphatidylinositol 4-kinase type 2